MSSDQDDNTLSGLPPLPSARFQPDDDAFTSLGSAAESVPGGPPEGVPESPVPDDDGLLATASSCVVMGPSNAGKTTLLVTLDQACSCPADDRFRLELVGGPGPGMEDLAAWGVRTIMGSNFLAPPTDRLKGYAASVTATEEKTFWRPERRYVSHLVFRDSPGGVLFPGGTTTPEMFAKFFAERRGAQLLAEAREAETLVLCVDATDPQPELVSQYMPKILADVAQRFRLPEPYLPLIHRLVRKLGPSSAVPTLRDERRVKAGHFLLLLTKVDQLLSQLDWEEDGSEIEPPRPADLAPHLSPIETACELLDESNLLRILNALKPDAKFAVGLTSSWGFDPYTGMPFMKSDEPIGLSTQDRSRRLLNWRPYGVREALLFITAGIAVGPVESVDRSTLMSRSKRRERDVDPRFFNVVRASRLRFLRAGRNRRPSWTWKRGC